MLQIDRKMFANFDWALLLTLLVVIAMSLVNLYSASYVPGSYSTPAYLKQIYYYIMGFALMLVIVSVDYRVLIKINYPLYGLIIGLLFFALFFGSSTAQTQRWINFGYFKLQPSEPAKLILVISLASYYYRKDTGKGFTLKELVVPGFLTGLPFVLILKQPDLGTALMLVFIFISMTLFVKLKWSSLVTLTTLGLSSAFIGWKFFLKDYQKQRIETFLNPEGDPLRTGYHIMQSKIAIGSGGKFGKGFFEGTQVHLDFLPERHTDFAFSVLGEEWGFVGAVFFLLCYFFMIFLGLNIALSSRDKFGVLLAFGIVSLIFWQAFINLAMILGLLPVVGMPLPLFSYGGSSLLTTMAGIGILFSIRMRRYRWAQTN